MSHPTPFFERVVARFDRHPNGYALVVVACYLFVNNSINATSSWMETTRDGSPAFQMWEPFCWEYSSALATLFCLLPIFWFWQRYPLRFAQPGRQLVVHLLVSLLFSVCHVALMVIIREGVYQLAGGDYEFGPWLREFVYEYRKDVWGYATFLVGYRLYRFAHSRVKGEANLIEDEVPEHHSAPPEDDAPEHLLVKKLDREFLVKVADIEWMESSGNYVNLHAGGRIYPLRSTLSQLTDRLKSRGFVRVHRSYSINYLDIISVSYNNSGDGEISLKSGQTVTLSRRYKDQLKRHWTDDVESAQA